MTGDDTTRTSAPSDPGTATTDSYHDLIVQLVAKQPQPQAGGEGAMHLWASLAAVVIPIIGVDGFNALYDRSLHRAGAPFASLVMTAELTKDGSTRFMRLKSGLQDAGTEAANRATVLMLSTFTDVLSTLIGEQLTHKILRTAWGGVFDESAQEIPRWSTK